MRWHILFRTCWQNACRSNVDYALTKMAGDRGVSSIRPSEIPWRSQRGNRYNEWRWNRCAGGTDPMRSGVLATRHVIEEFAWTAE